MNHLGLFFLLMLAGCAVTKPAPSASPPPRTDSSTPATDKNIAKAESPPAGVPAKPLADQNGKKTTVAPSQKKKETRPSLDLSGLETRLKETKAIGVFTKITLKNQVDDLLEQFRAYYQGKAGTTLAELRQPYDRLLLKVLSLLQDGDPELAREIVSSREAIWSILADPAKFANL